MKPVVAEGKRLIISLPSFEENDRTEIHVFKKKIIVVCTGISLTA
jgi:hypothetical protein